MPQCLGHKEWSHYISVYFYFHLYFTSNVRASNITPTLLRHYQKQCCFRNERNKINSRTRSANMTAGHYLVLSAPSTAGSRAVDSKQSARTKPKGFALTALCDCRAFRTKAMEDSRLCQYLAEHGDISHKALCHLYT